MVISIINDYNHEFSMIYTVNPLYTDTAIFVGIIQSNRTDSGKRNFIGIVIKLSISRNNPPIF